MIIDTGTAIIVGCTILGGIATMFRILGNKRINGKSANSRIDSFKKSTEDKFGKVVFNDVCDAYREGQDKQFNMLKEIMQNGFKGINGRLDKL